ncbi:ead/Ea22-like family protein [Pseudomonas sp. p1(2021b)]|uniref:ead/Ea22-like family protein n=1 Tax=Pseudomonas sp. p1(2021b) TaxID=2874628 RepID=UPI001CCC34D4|nr:ead/Ea22-like family protein [Pseudomonas sp. p1(2021b)]UBM23319.1 ead/Ea22-like family protein [Pseudomonas sp. p1(2021b)]
MDTNKMRELKELAEAAGSDEWYAAGDLRYCDDKTGETHGLHHDDSRFIAAASPATVLALLAEVERLAISRSKKERELEQELETWRHGPFCWTCGDTGDVHDITGEWRGECDCLSAQLINANRERDQFKAENEALRSLVLSALEESNGRPGSGGNAPGHCHEVPGVWDRGNGDRSGTQCGWCRIWSAAQAMAKEARHDR